MVVDWNQVAQLCGTLGGFGLIGKWLVRSVDKANDSIPAMLQNLKTLNESVETLFKTATKHSEDIVEVRTIVNRCDNCKPVHVHSRQSD